MDVALGDVNVGEEMEKAEEVETTVTVTEGMKTAVITTAGSTRTVLTTTTASSSTQVVTAEVYARPYAKTTESRGERSKARSERKEAMEREAMIQRQKDEEDCIAREREAAEQRKVIERALLEEEEKAQVELLRKLREKTEKKELKDTVEGEPKKSGKEAKTSSERGASKDESEKREKEDENVSKSGPKKHDKQAQMSSEWETSKDDEENVSKIEPKKHGKEAKTSSEWGTSKDESEKREKEDENVSKSGPKKHHKQAQMSSERETSKDDEENVSKIEPKKHGKGAKKSAEREAKKRKYLAEEEERYADDEELDPDFNPDKEFIEEDDMVIEEDDEEDTFEVHKHSHALNFAEAGEFVVWVRATLNELQRAVKRGKEMAKHYREFVSVLKDAIIRMGSWGPMEGADVDEVVKTIVDLNCTAWKKAMLGVKTANSKMIMKIEEKQEGVIRVIEEKDIPAEDDTTVVDPEKLKGKTEEEKKEVKRMLRKFWSHVEKAHEEAARVAGELGRLSMVLEPDDYFKLVEVGTRPIITMEIPKAKQMIEQQKEAEERARSREDMKNMKIEDIIIEQNLPTPLDRWKGSKVQLPTHYLAAAVHYFVYLQADQANPMTNKFVAEKFKLSLSNLHRIITGRRYSGGSTKVTSEEHGERFVKVAKAAEMTKGKGRGKSSAVASAAKGTTKKSDTKVMVAKVAPKLSDLPFLEDTPAEGTRGAKKRRKDDDPKGKK